ncbi:MAG: hypothetical protein IJ899_13250 [Blautia sp.]|nr:hypothetical protein [Blautia sp.]
MGLWINKRTEGSGSSKKICWDVEITKGDSGYITVALTDLQEQDLELREEDTVRCQVRSKQGTLLIDSTAKKLAGGYVLWHLTPEETKDLEPGEYLWDMQLELPDSNDIFTFIPTSDFVISAEQTKRRCACEQ